MNVADFLVVLRQERDNRAYIRRLEIRDHTSLMLKARLIISSDLFIQIYRNDQFDTANLVLLHNKQRIYGRDYLGGVWHRHPVDTPHAHDTSAEGRRPIALAEFLDEVELILAKKGLP
ncbi:MAG: hypothetical protein GY803_29970 [Chloroflexi bacterium]|nr:hypothetical protein [Chloroflexota bacterium]